VRAICLLEIKISRICDELAENALHQALLDVLMLAEHRSENYVTNEQQGRKIIPTRAAVQSGSPVHESGELYFGGEPGDISVRRNEPSRLPENHPQFGGTNGQNVVAPNGNYAPVSRRGLSLPPAPVQDFNAPQRPRVQPQMQRAPGGLVLPPGQPMDPLARGFTTKLRTAKDDGDA
jgi:hypothetical protein